MIYKISGESMKKNKMYIKTFVAVFMVSLFLLAALPANAFNQEINNLEHQTATIDSKQPLSNDFWRSVPSSGLIYTGFPLIARIFFDSPYYPIKMVDWSNKPFPRPTLMWIGSGIGIRPGLPIFFLLLGEMIPGITYIDLYSDGEFYAKLTGINGLIPVAYYEKGFHNLLFVPEEFENETLEIDVQIGLNGFVENILPYLT